MRASARTERPGATDWSTSWRLRSILVVTALVAGYGGAAAIDGWLRADELQIATAADLGPAGDGLTRLLVTLPGGITAGELNQLAALPGVESTQTLFDGSALIAGQDITAGTVHDALPAAEVSPSPTGTMFAAPVSDPYWSSYGWNLENTGSNAYQQAAVAGADISAPSAWAAGTGRGMVVAVIDSGVMTSHPDLDGSLWTDPTQSCSGGDGDGDGLIGDCHGWNFYQDNADVTNSGVSSAGVAYDNSHGTGVAGIVGARAGNGQGSAGVAPDVSIMPLVIGSGKSVDMALGAQAIRYAADHGANVINASWGGPGASTILSQAIEYANGKGVVVVAAAGNDGLSRDTSLFYPASLTSPNLITVGNSTATDTVSSSSAFGATSVDLFAPGNLVFTLKNDGTYYLMSGTSLAAPHVAAAAALYRAKNPTATATEIKDKLLADVEPVPAFAGKSVTGGRLSLTALGNASAPVSYAFTGMTTPSGTVAPSVVATGSAPAGSYAVKVGLGMEYNGQLLALTQQPITLAGATVATDDSGEALFSLGSRTGLGSLALAPSTTLAEGRYVLTAQLYRDGAPLGSTYAAPLLVNDSYGSATPPATSGTTPPATGGSTPPATGGSTPPATGGTKPPATGGTTPPATGGTHAPGHRGDHAPGHRGDHAPGHGRDHASGHGWHDAAGDGWDHASGHGWHDAPGDGWDHASGHGWHDAPGDRWDHASGHGWQRAAGDRWGQGLPAGWAVPADLHRPDPGEHRRRHPGDHHR